MWQAILDGDLAASARRTVLHIARGIEREDDPRRIPQRALFWAYVAGAFDDAWIATAYDDALTALAGDLDRRVTDLSLFNGLAGAGFVIAHVSEPGSAEDSLQAIDGVITGALDHGPWPGHFDLISGLTGIGVYLLERGAPRSLLDRVVAQLVARMQRAAWFTPLELLPIQHHAECPDGYFNVGVAHGTPGVVALLGRIAALPDADPAVREITIEAMRWVLGTRHADAGFPAWVLPDDPKFESARTAWCYGDPGVAIALWGASARLGLPVDEARAFALACTQREDTGVIDAGLCHGAAGLAHLFNRCFQASGDTVFREAARTWFRRTVDMGGPDGNYLAWAMNERGVLEWRHATSILAGTAGIALALLGAITNTAPSWDRLLLCDLP